VVENLLTNAIKFTPAGGAVSVEVASEPNGAFLRVSDTGKGIAPEDVRHLFERFYRASGTDGVPGAGLGLAIVKAIAETHGGTVEVESELGRGTSFTVHVPDGSTLAAAA
jgi:two-component system phosphate regulon sensor histidine kinase PhoR